MRLLLLRHIKHLTVSIVLLGAATVLVGTTGILAGTAGLPLGASTACGCLRLFEAHITVPKIAVGQKGKVVFTNTGDDTVKIRSEVPSEELTVVKDETGCLSEERATNTSCETEVERTKAGEATYKMVYESSKEPETKSVEASAGE